MPILSPWFSNPCTRPIPELPSSTQEAVRHAHPPPSPLWLASAKLALHSQSVSPLFLPPSHYEASMARALSSAHSGLITKTSPEAKRTAHNEDLAEAIEQLSQLERLTASAQDQYFDGSGWGWTKSATKSAIHRPF